MKKLIRIVAGVLVLLLVVLLLWEIIVVQREAPSIKSVVYEYLDARKLRDAERAYAQVLPVEEGGKSTREGLEHGFTTWPQIFLEKYKSVEVKIAWIIQGDALVRGKFFYNSCDIWFDMSLIRTARGWKVYSMVMPIHEDNLDCIDEK